MLEMESLSPLVILEPEGTFEHTENWQLFKGVPKPETEEDIEEHILKYIQHEK